MCDFSDQNDICSGPEVLLSVAVNVGLKVVICSCGFLICNSLTVADVVREVPVTSDVVGDSDLTRLA
jgi:hypothetical protein